MGGRLAEQEEISLGGGGHGGLVHPNVRLGGGGPGGERRESGSSDVPQRTRGWEYSVPATSGKQIWMLHGMICERGNKSPIESGKRGRRWRSDLEFFLRNFVIWEEKIQCYGSLDGTTAKVVILRSTQCAE